MKKLLFSIILMLSIFCVEAQTNYTWTGTAGNNLWATATNWSPAVVPTSNDNVTIGSVANPIIISANTTVRQLTTTNGSKLHIMGATLNISTIAIINGLTLTNSNGYLNIGTSSSASTSCTIESSNFNTTLTVYSNVTVLKSNVFIGANVLITKKGSGNSDDISSGNTFGDATYPGRVEWNNLSSTKDVYLNSGITSTSDLYRGGLILTQSVARTIYIGYSNSTTFSGFTTSLNPGGMNLVDKTTFTAGNLKINKMSRTSTTAFSMSLGTSAYLTLTNSTISGDFTLSSGGTKFQANTFNGNVFVTKSGAGHDYTLSNIFNSNLDWTNSSITAGVWIYLNNGTSATQDTYNGNLTLNSTVSLNFQIGGYGAATNILSTKLFQPGTTGFNFGFLRLYNLTNNNPALSTWNCGNSVFFYMYNSTFYGGLNINANYILSSACIFKGASVWSKNSSSLTQETGGSTFEQDMTYTHNSTGNWSPGYSTANIYKGNVTVNGSGAGVVTLATVSTNFSKNLIVNYNNFQLGTTTGVANFVGTTAQSISGTGTGTGVQFYKININNPNHVTLLRPIDIYNSINFTSGKLITSATAYPTMLSGTIFSGTPSTTSYIDGPVARVGSITGNVLIPVGKGSTYNPITISASTSATTDKYLFEAFVGVTPPYSTALTSPMTVLSDCKYWKVDRLAGTANISLVFNLSPNCSSTPNPSCLISAKLNASNSWEYQSNDVVSSTTITTAATTGSLGYYTQGNADPIFNLPSSICLPSNWVGGVGNTLDLSQYCSPHGGFCRENGVINSSNVQEAIATPSNDAVSHTITYEVTVNGCPKSVTKTTNIYKNKQYPVDGILENGTKQICMGDFIYLCTNNTGNPQFNSSYYTSASGTGVSSSFTYFNAPIPTQYVFVSYSSGTGTFPITITNYLSGCAQSFNVEVKDALSKPNNLITPTSPDGIVLNSLASSISASIAGDAGTTYNVKLKMYPSQLIDGTLLPDYTTVLYSTVQAIGANTNFNTVLNTISGLSIPQKSTTYFYQLGAEVNSVYQWSDLSTFILEDVEGNVPSAFLATNGGGTANNKINWVYSVNYLDEAKTDESIAYIDGLGQTRQVQTKLSTSNIVMAVETAYSEEGGDNVNTLPAPTGGSDFAYAVRFFDVKNTDGTFVDYGTEHFDRSDATTKLPMSPVAADITAGVGKYYSANNTQEANVDDAQGYPFSYDIALPNPGGRVYKTSAPGGDFRINGGKETTYLYGKATEKELTRVFGKTAATSLALSTSKTIVIDPNGVGQITYTDKEGKTIATAMKIATCSNQAAGLDDITENGTTAFSNIQDLIGQDQVDRKSLERRSSSQLYASCALQPVIIKHDIEYKSFVVDNFGTSACMACKYNVELKIVEDNTNTVVYSKTNVLQPSAGVNACSTETKELINETVTLPNVGNYTVYRVIKQYTNPTTGKTLLEEELDSWDTQVKTTAADQMKTQFLAEKYSNEDWFVLREIQKPVAPSDAQLSTYDCKQITKVLGSYTQMGSSAGVSAENVRTNNLGGVAKDNLGNVFYISGGALYVLENGLVSKLTGEVATNYALFVEGQSYCSQEYTFSSSFGDIEITANGNIYYTNTYTDQYNMVTLVWKLEKNKVLNCTSDYRITLVKRILNQNYSPLPVKYCSFLESDKNSDLFLSIPVSSTVCRLKLASNGYTCQSVEYLGNVNIINNVFQKNDGDVVGNITATKYSAPTDMAFDYFKNKLYISDLYNHKIKEIDLNLSSNHVKTVTTLSNSDGAVGMTYVPNEGVLFGTKVSRSTFKLLNVDNYSISDYVGGTTAGVVDGINACGAQIDNLLSTSESVISSDKIPYINYSTDGSILFTSMQSEGGNVGSAIRSITKTICSSPCSTSTSQLIPGATRVFYNHNVASGTIPATVDEGKTPFLSTASLQMNFREYDFETLLTGIDRESYGMMQKGYIYIDNDATYSFSATSNSGIKLKIDGNLVLSEWSKTYSCYGCDAPTIGTAVLTRGYHYYEIEFFDHGVHAGDAYFNMQYGIVDASNNVTYTSIPDNKLFITTTTNSFDINTIQQNGTVKYLDQVNVNDYGNNTFNLYNLDGRDAVTGAREADIEFDDLVPGTTLKLATDANNPVFKAVADAYRNFNGTADRSVQLVQEVTPYTATVSGASFGTLPMLNTNKTTTTPNVTVTLYKVKYISPSCADQCTLPQSQDCTPSCNENKTALKVQYEVSYSDMAKSTKVYSIDNSFETPAGEATSYTGTLKMLVDNNKPYLPTVVTDNLEEKDLALYNDMVAAKTMYENFDMAGCISVCQGNVNVSDICTAGKINYYNCFNDNYESLTESQNTLINKWTGSTFPYESVAAPADPANRVPSKLYLEDDVNLYNSYYYDYLVANFDNFKNGTAGLTKNNIQTLAPTGTILQTATTPTINANGTTGCSNAKVPNSDQIVLAMPLNLVSILDLMNSQCVNEFKNTLNQGINPTYNTCFRNLSNALTSLTYDLSNSYHVAFKAQVESALNGATPGVSLPALINNSNYTSIVSLSNLSYSHLNPNYDLMDPVNATVVLATDPATQKLQLASYNVIRGFNLALNNNNCFSPSGLDNEELKARKQIIKEAIAPLYTDATLLDTEVNRIYNNTIVGASGTTAAPQANQEKLRAYMIDYASYLYCTKTCSLKLDKEYASWLEIKRNEHRDAVYKTYINSCFPEKPFETLTASFSEKIYHYTLYNYNNAEQLVSTVPPAGIDYIDVNSTNTAELERVPSHKQLTYYQSNSYGWLKNTSAPDKRTNDANENPTNYYYDIAGRIRFSQTSEQQNRNGANSPILSYTHYDDETGRILQTGECTLTVGVDPATKTESLTWPANTDGVHKDVSVFHYDTKDPSLPATYVIDTRYLKERVSYVENANAKTHFSYDAHGRVNMIVQEMLIGSTALSSKYKTVNYEYSSLTSRVNKITFQAGTAEQFIHKYTYDADDRLIKAEVSKDNATWETISQYSYYLHGPLKNNTLGNNIQQLDYIYNLQGWLKAINGNTVTGIGTNAAGVSGDVFGEVLHYYTGDYKNTTVGLHSANNSKTRIISTAYTNLYNGTITATTTYTGFSIAGVLGTDNTNFNYLARSYKYDVLYRLKNTQTQVTGTLSLTNWTSVSLTDVFNERITYDANGNIATLQRSGATVGTLRDNLTYYYNKNNVATIPSPTGGAAGTLTNNQLLQVTDAGDVTAGYKPVAGTAYSYDLQGRLTKDLSKQIQTITWTTFNKPSTITRTTGSTKPNLTFKYDAFGRRIYKLVDYPTTVATPDYEEWYIQDASGNELTTYKRTGAETTASQQQMLLYAASKVGYYNSTTGTTIVTGSLLFEVTDHLGSVRAIVTGAKVSDGAGGLKANIVTLTDYYAFGSATSRKFTSTVEGSQIYGFHGMKRDNQLDDDDDYTTEYRQYDSDLGRWLSPDPLMSEFADVTPYNFCHNDPVNTTDRSGLADGKGWAKVKAFLKRLFGGGKEGDHGVGNNIKTPGRKGKKKVGKVEPGKPFVSQEDWDRLKELNPVNFVNKFSDALGESKKKLEQDKEGGVVRDYAISVMEVVEFPFQGYKLLKNGTDIKNEKQPVSSYALKAVFILGVPYLKGLHGHHLVPKFLKGLDVVDNILMIKSTVHMALHSKLNKALQKAGMLPGNASAARWRDYFNINPEKQKEAYDILEKVTKEIDEEHGTDIWQWLKKSLDDGLYNE